MRSSSLTLTKTLQGLKNGSSSDLTVSLLTLLHDKQGLMSVQVFNVESSEDLAAV